MDVNNSKKNKHLTLNDRIEIQEGLNRRLPFKTIAGIIQKDPTTVSKEVKRNFLYKETNVSRNTSPTCPLLLKAPFVCNACPRKNRDCGFNRQVYYAQKAQEKYENLLVESREGIPLNKEEFYKVDDILFKGIKKGQHLYHIIKTHDLPVSQSTVYRHVKKGYSQISPIDLPRMVKFKQRRKTGRATVPKIIKAGRTFLDFKAFLEENQIGSWVEMDTVIGKIGGKTLLTFDFTFCNFMFAKLLDDKTAGSVSEAFEVMRDDFTRHSLPFKETFQVILTDNGGEFSNVFAIEEDVFNKKEINLFYCDPYQSSQKPKVEKNHTLFRDIAPKGTSFDDWTQEDVDYIFSNINSIKRKSLNGKTPYELFTFTFGQELSNLLGIKEIPATEVIQSVKLLNQISKSN